MRRATDASREEATEMDASRFLSCRTLQQENQIQNLRG